MTKKTKREFILDPSSNGDTVLDNCIGSLKSKTRDYVGNKNNPPLIVTIEPYTKPRTLPQNAYMWAALMTALEKSGVPRPGSTETMSKEGWHYYLRIEFGYIIGTTARYLPGGYKVECPDPQPTAAGEDGQMDVSTHAEYCAKVEAFMAEHGIQPIPYKADDYSGQIQDAA